MKTHVLRNKTFRYIDIDNEGMCQVLFFSKGKSFQPVLTTQQMKRIQDIIESTNQNKIDLLWLQIGIKRKYYLFK